ncbi:MAG TPA: hypothetical protein VHH14_02190, partial [Solirubrobacterales bacterium]|nr:hypothetical protein [Solirubrobacterales bacterium]
MTDDDGTRKAALRGRLVEGVRLIFIPVLGAAGYQVGATLDPTTGTRALLYVFLGAACGYVIGGILGRLTLRAVSGVEAELRRTPAAEIAGGVVGLVLGLVVSALLMLPLLFLPAAAAWPSILFIYLTLGSLGIRSGRA